MAKPIADLKTHTATATADSVTVRGKDLIHEIMGQQSFTATLFLLIKDRFPTAGELRVLDACLVSLMEHGLNPTTLITRLLAYSVPGEMQVAMAGGLMGVGSVFAGTMDGCAALLSAGVSGAEPAEDYCQRVVAEHRASRSHVPGFGHATHKPDDPRALRLLTIGQEAGVSGAAVALLRQLADAVDAAHGRHITINATGAIAALMLDIGLPADILRGLAVVSRSGGLIGHIVEERRSSSAQRLVSLAREAIPYEHPPSE